MIDIQKLTQEDVGKWVIYEPSYGSRELGRIKSWNEKWIFVVYKCDVQWSRFKDFTAAATFSEDLTFVD